MELYDIIMAEIDRLMDVDPELDSKDSACLELLVSIIERYEADRYPDRPMTAHEQRVTREKV